MKEHDNPILKLGIEQQVTIQLAGIIEQASKRGKQFPEEEIIIMEAKIRKRFESTSYDNNRKEINEQAKQLLERLKEFSRRGSEINNRNDSILKLLEYSAGERLPIRFFVFWGIGEKLEADERDNAYAEYLRALNDSMKKIHPPGVKTSIILADIHGIFNGYVNPKQLPGLPPYLQDVHSRLTNTGFQTYILSQLYEEMGVELPRLDRSAKLSNRAHCIYNQFGKRLIESAEKHGRSDLNAREASLLYIQMRLNEIPILERFKDEIFLVKGSKQMWKWHHPADMPVVYIPGDCPWYSKSEKQYPSMEKRKLIE